MKKRQNFLQVLFFPHAFAFHHSHFHSFPRPHFTEGLHDYNNCSKSSTSTGRNMCSTSSGSISPPKICSYFSSLMHSCPSFCSEEHFRTLSSLHVTISSCRRWGRNYLKSCDTGGKTSPWLLEVGLCGSLPCNNLQSWFQQLLTVLWRFDLWPNFNFPTEYN